MVVDPYQKIRLQLAWKHSPIYRFFIIAAFAVAIPTFILPDLFNINTSKTIKISLTILLFILVIIAEIFKSRVVKENKDEYNLEVKKRMPQIKDTRKLQFTVLAIIVAIFLVIIFVLNSGS